MSVKPIRSEADHAVALRRIEELWDSDRPEDQEELDVLSVLVEAYEREHHRIDAPDPISAVKFRMEQAGYGRADLVNLLGAKSRATEILKRTRRLTLEMIRRLNRYWHIPADILIQESSLDRKGPKKSQRHPPERRRSAGTN
jgi:HTH-type transcriptional regulator/antitoxin HigA